MQPDHDTLIDQRIEEWKQRLVDLSRRNRLLYYRPTASTTLRVMSPGQDEVFDRLALRERPWRFWCPPPPEEEDGEEDAPQTASGRRDFSEVSVSLAAGSGELTTHLTTPTDLVRVLKNLHRRARTDFEERGVRILHVAFGTLEWRDQEDGDPVRSPLVLVPVELVRESAREPFELLLADEEIVLNPALDIKLRTDFATELPPLPDEWDVNVLDEYLDTVSQHVAGAGWTVSRDAVVGLYSFHKLVIFRDLDRNHGRVRTHRVIRALGGEPIDDSSGSVDVPRPENIDTELDPRDALLVVDADSSQLASIEAVKRGSDLVLHGPPGTGKSQTITNVIADFIARGKTVLFVSEKMAALEVVYKRLQDRHLGHFCLELHSHRANKKRVVEELSKCLEEDLVPQSGLSTTDADALCRRRDQLREYVQELHVARSPLERSVFDVLAELAQLHSVPLVAFDYHAVASLSPSRQSALGETAARLSGVWQVAAEGEAYPWYGCKESRYTEAIRDAYDELLSRCATALSATRSAASAAAERLGLDEPSTIAGCRWLHGLLQMLPDCPTPESSWFATADLDRLLRSAESTASRCRERQEIRERLGGAYGMGFLALRADLCDALRRARDDLVGQLGESNSGPDCLADECATIGDWADRLARSVEDWEACARLIANDLGLGDRYVETAPLRQCPQLVELCADDDKPDREWLSATALSEVSGTLGELRQPYDAFEMARRELTEAGNTASTELLPTKRRLQAVHGEGFFRVTPGLSQTVEAALADLMPLLSITPSDNQTLVRECPAIHEWASHFAGCIAPWSQAGQQIVQELGLASRELTTGRLAQLARVVELCTEEDRPERGWMGPTLSRELTDELPVAKELYQTHQASRERLMERYTETLFDLDLDGLVAAFSNNYESATKWVRPGYYRDRRSIRRCALDGRLPNTVREDLIETREVTRKRARIGELEEQHKALFGSFYRGADTDFDRITNAVATAQELLKLTARWRGADRLWDIASAGGDVPSSLLEAAHLLRAGLKETQEAASELDCIRSLPGLPQSGKEPGRSSLGDLFTWAEGVADSSGRLAAALHELRTKSKRGALTDLDQLYVDADDLDLVRAAEELDLYGQMLLELDMQQLYEQLPTRCPSLCRWLSLRYSEGTGLVCAISTDNDVPAVLREAFAAAREATKTKAAADRQSAETKRALGPYYEGYLTDFDRARRALANAREILDLSKCDVAPGELVRAASTRSTVPTAVAQAARTIREGLADAEKSAEKFASAVGFSEPRADCVAPAHMPAAELQRWASDVADASARLRTALEEIAAACDSGMPRNVDQACDDLSALNRMTALERQMGADHETLVRQFGRFFAGLESDWDRLLAALSWSQRLADQFPGKAVPQGLVDAVCEFSAEFPDAEHLRDQLQGLGGCLDELGSKFDVPVTVDGEAPEEVDLCRLDSRIREMLSRVHEIADWVHFQRCSAEFRESGLGHLLDRLLAAPPEAGVLPRTVRRSVLQQWYEHTTERVPVLRHFRGEDHADLIAEFRELDSRHWELGTHRVIAEANAHKPHPGYAPSGSEVRVLRQEALKRRRHLPIRKLFARMPLLVTRLKPCLLMSPLSVSQFLPPDSEFDLVVFDEASQIRAEDAVGALYRARQTLVCGDPKQLPPTSFFDRAMAEEFDEDDESTADEFDVLDSVLEDCLALGMPEGWLRWHYRSRHESLITFSNARLYDWRLITFPSAEQEHESLGVQLLHVPDGVYDRGGRRDNRREAEVVVDLIVEHIQSQPDRSLGVVAFSQAQMTAIEDLLESRLREFPDLELLLQAEGLERFFVKNLENVQGDERDVILFSIGYGPDETGRLTMNFGPLNRSGGERRLNVAVTRAREKVVVVSSIRAGDMDLSATQAAGVLMLNRYLAYAEQGRSALDSSPPGALTGDYESPLEEDVAAAIRGLGYDVQPQIGCSGFRIDLGVVDPTQPGRFALGVECDGATYHSSYVARDKDRLRQAVLESLGWTIHRVWSPDWVARRDHEVERLKAAIEKSIARPTRQRERAAGTTDQRTHGTDSPTVAAREAPKLTDTNGARNADWAEPYVLADLSSRKGRRGFYDPSARPEQARLVAEIARVEGPVHRDAIARRLAEAWDMRRVGSRIQDIVDDAINAARRKRSVQVKGDFVLSRDSGDVARVRVPVPDDPRTCRPIEHIAPSEIACAMQHLVREAVGIPRQSLVTEAARVLGFDRTGHRIQERLRGVLSSLVARKKLVVDGDLIHLGESESA